MLEGLICFACGMFVAFELMMVWYVIKYEHENKDKDEE